MAQAYEPVKQGPCADPGWPENSLDNVFFLVLNLFYSFQRGSNSFITEGSNMFRRGPNFFQGRVQMLSIETHITCDFPGRGVRTPYPPSGSAHGILTPWFAYRIMVYQKLNKNGKNTTRQRLISHCLWPAARDSVVYTG